MRDFIYEGYLSKVEPGARGEEVMDESNKEIICISCPMGCTLQVHMEGKDILVKGNQCKRGEAFAKSEMKNPTRSLTTTVRTIFKEMPLLSVRTEVEIPKDKVFEAMKILNKILIKEEVTCGDIILQDILGTGCNVIATNTIYEKPENNGTFKDKTDKLQVSVRGEEMP